MQQHHVNPSPAFLARPKGGTYLAKLVAVRRFPQILGMLGETPMIELQYRSNGKIIPLVFREALRPGSVLWMHLSSMLGREVTPAEAQAPENFLLNRRCWLRLGYRHGLINILECRSP